MHKKGFGTAVAKLEPSRHIENKQQLEEIIFALGPMRACALKV